MPNPHDPANIFEKYYLYVHPRADRPKFRIYEPSVLMANSRHSGRIESKVLQARYSSSNLIHRDQPAEVAEVVELDNDLGNISHGFIGNRVEHGDSRA